MNYEALLALAREEAEREITLYYGKDIGGTVREQARCALVVRRYLERISPIPVAEVHLL